MAGTGATGTGGGGAGGELVDVVDEHDRVLRTVTRAELRRDRLRHRCVFIVVRRPDGTLLVHQRSPHKDVWPSRWDLAVGGVVGAGEGWDSAAARELAEEVGISDVPLTLVHSGRYDDADVAEVARVYAATWDGPITFADGEVVDAVWLDGAEVRRRIDAAPGSFCPDSVALALPLFSRPSFAGPFFAGPSL